MKKHCILYPIKPLIFCQSLLFLRIKRELLIVYGYKFICVYIVSFYANITKIGTRSHALQIYSIETRQGRSCSCTKNFVKVGVAKGYLSRVLNTIITDKIIMIKITQPKRLFSTFSFTERQ